jgi:phytoene/squalene synthetase
MDANLASRLAHSVRAADPDRYFATLFAPPTVRPYLFAFYAFNAEVSRIAESVREPMLGAIRLDWWRETAEGAASRAPLSVRFLRVQCRGKPDRGIGARAHAGGDPPGMVA